MQIGGKLELIRYTLVTLSKSFDDFSPITRRLVGIGVLTELAMVNKRLEALSGRMDTEICVEDGEIDFQTWLVDTGWMDVEKMFDIQSFEVQENKNAVLDLVAGYLPVDVNGHSFTKEQETAFRSAMHQFCDNEKLGRKDIIYAIQKGLKEVAQSVERVKMKMSNIPSYQYEDYWYKFLEENTDKNRAKDIYEHWKDEYDDLDKDMLKDKQMQEILVLLKSGFFSQVPQPTDREVGKSRIRITRESFDRSTTIPKNIEIDCARMSRFVEWKEETILVMDCIKLGKYVYKHFRTLTPKQVKSIVHFYTIVELIHEDIANLDARYKKYLRNYEGDEQKSVYQECVKMLNTCLPHVTVGIGEDFFERMLTAVTNSDMKAEVKAKLRGASRPTTLCAMLGACKNSGKVFKPDVIADDLAGSLSTLIDKPNRSSLKRYIDNGTGNPRSKIHTTTEDAIKEYLRPKTDNHSG